MKRSLCMTITIAALIIAFGAAVGIAGEKQHKKCDAPKEQCKKKMAAKFSHKAWLGIEMDATKDGHYKITRVVPESPAAKAGFAKDDLLLSMNGEDYSEKNMKAVKKMWSALEPGAKAKYTVLRSGEKIGLKAKLGSLPVEYQKKYMHEHFEKFHQES